MQILLKKLADLVDKTMWWYKPVTWRASWFIAAIIYESQFEHLLVEIRDGNLIYQLFEWLTKNL